MVFGVSSHSVREQVVPALGTCTGAQMCQACSCFLGQTNRNCTGGFSLLTGLTQISSADGNSWSFVCLVTAPLKALRLGHGTLVVCERFSRGAGLGMTGLGKRWGKTEGPFAELLFK